MKTETTTVFVVDDDPGLRRGLARLLKTAGHVVETFESAADYLAHNPPPGPNCVVLDVHMPEITGLELQTELAKRGREDQIIFITAHAAVPMSVQAMKGGAVDFLVKPFVDSELFAAVDRALERSAEHDRNKSTRDSARARFNSLTEREFEVMQCVSAGLLNKQIADQLGVALGTIKVHRGRVMEKLGVVSVADLVRLVEQAAIPSPDVVKASGN